MVGVGGRSHVKRCHTCRQRKVKCDGENPACRRCLDHGLQCPGYSRNLEFVFYDCTPSSKRNTGCQQKNPKLPTNQKIQPRRQYDHVVKITDGYESLSHSLAVPQNKAGLLAVLQERYLPQLPSFSTEKANMAGPNWIATACSLALSSQYSEMLSDSLLAMSLSLVNLEKQEDQLSTASLKQYSRALNGLRSGLAPGPSGLTQSQIDISLVTCLACGMYEMMTNKSLTALTRHLNGVSAILKASGVQNLQSESSRRTFYEYRAIYLPIALSIRKANYLSSPEWIDPPWKRLEQPGFPKLHAVIDIGFTVPVLMERFDDLQRHDPERSEAMIMPPLNDIILEGLALRQAFEDWEFRIRGGDEKTQLYIPRLAKPLDPSLSCSTSNPYPTSFAFSSWDDASALTYYEMLQVFLFTLLIDISAFAQRSNFTPAELFKINTSEFTRKSIGCADRIFQSIEWFLDDNKKLIGRMVILASFEAAKGLILRLASEGTGDVELDEAVSMKTRFCEMITKRIVDSGLPVWGG